MLQLRIDEAAIHIQAFILQLGHMTAIISAAHISRNYARYPNFSLELGCVPSEKHAHEQLGGNRLVQNSSDE